MLSVLPQAVDMCFFTDGMIMGMKRVSGCSQSNIPYAMANAVSFAG
jgi:hypothetical protein